MSGKKWNLEEWGWFGEWKGRSMLMPHMIVFKGSSALEKQNPRCVCAMHVSSSFYSPSPQQ